jgi:hypothetical protein
MSQARLAAPILSTCAQAALASAPLALLMPVQPWLALLSALAGVAAMYLREQSPGAPDAPKSDAGVSGSE